MSLCLDAVGTCGNLTVKHHIILHISRMARTQREELIQNLRRAISGMEETIKVLTDRRSLHRIEARHRDRDDWQAINHMEEAITELIDTLTILESSRGVFGYSTASSSPTRVQKTQSYHLPRHGIGMNAQIETPPAISESENDTAEQGNGYLSRPVFTGSSSQMFQTQANLRPRHGTGMNTQEETPPAISEREIPAPEDESKDCSGDLKEFSAPRRVQVTLSYDLPRHGSGMNVQVETPPAISESENDTAEEENGYLSRPVFTGSHSGMFQTQVNLHSRHETGMNVQGEKPPAISQNEIPAKQEVNRELSGEATTSSSLSMIFRDIQVRSKILMNTQGESLAVRIAVGAAVGVNCVICQNRSGNRKMKTISCGHDFHEKCIDKWSNWNNHCPLCRYVSPNLRRYQLFSNEEFPNIFSDFEDKNDEDSD